MSHPARETQPRAEQSFARPTPSAVRLVSGASSAGAAWGGRVGGGDEGGGDGIPPSRKSFRGGGAGPTPSGVLQTAEPGSRRPHWQRGAPQRPPHWHLAPRGLGTWAAKRPGPDTLWGRPPLPGQHTGTPRFPAALRGSKIHPPDPLPQPAVFARPQRRATPGKKPPASRGRRPPRCPDLLPGLPVRTPTRI